MKIHVHHYIERDYEVLSRLDVISRKIDLILGSMRNIMASMADLQAAVSRNTDAEDAVIVLLKGISQQLKDAKGDPVAIDAVVAQIDANTAKLGAAVVENTPAA